MKKTGVLLMTILLALSAILGCAPTNAEPAPAEQATQAPAVTESPAEYPALTAQPTEESAVTDPSAAEAQDVSAIESGITISTKPKTVTTEMEDVTLLILNNTGKTYSTDYVQKLEVLTNGEWKEVPLTTDAVSLALLTVPDGEMMEYVFDFAHHYAPLAKGTYRIIKTFVDDGGNKIEAQCEFDLF